MNNMRTEVKKMPFIYFLNLDAFKFIEYKKILTNIALFLSFRQNHLCKSWIDKNLFICSC